MPLLQGSLLLVLATAIALTGCGKKAEGAGAAKSQPPPTVEVEAARAGALEMTLVTSGELTALDRVALSPRVTGTVGMLRIEDGAAVEKGALLVELDTAEATADLREASALRDQAGLELKRAQPLAEAGMVDASRLDQLRAAVAVAEARVAAAQARLDERRIFAPFAGRLGLRQVSVGAFVAPGATIATLTRLSPLKVSFSVPESELARLKPGLAVRGRTPAFGGRAFDGTIAAIDPVIDPATRQVAVQALLPNADEVLRPGMSMAVEIVVQTLADAVTVPERAVVLQGGQASVFAVDRGESGTVAKRVTVSLGSRRDGRVHIAEGLAAGRAVVIEGLQVVRDGAPVALREPATAAAPTAPAAAPAKAN